MLTHRTALIRSLWLVLALSQPAGAADATSATDVSAVAESEQEALRDRLTEREDRRRPLEPFSINVGGRPLTIGGEYEISLDYVRRRFFGPGDRRRDRLLLEQGIEGEIYYSFGPPLSLFAQMTAGMEEDLLPRTFEKISDSFAQRGEMWLYSENIAGSHISIDLGRLNFEDDRRWWWDEDLDAVRLIYERETFELTLAAARELGAVRSDQDRVAPEQERVRRVIGEASWDFKPNHALELFLLHQDDGSPADEAGRVVRTERVDESDARLTWLGARASGGFDLGARGLLGYWLDTARVRGRERFIEFEALSETDSEAQESSRRDVRGWAADAGINWILPLGLEPRLFAGYAFGSGDSAPEDSIDRSFRQTGLHANESGFGGVQRFTQYGILLDPELSNLRILTVGAGLSLLKSSSLDVVFHRYRLVEPASALRDARLEFELTGANKDVGSALDVVLAIEEWDRLEFEFSASAFRAGRAFGAEAGTWSYGAFLAMRIAF